MASDTDLAGLAAMRESFPAFFAADPPNEPYIYGRHTRAVIAACDRVVRNITAGIPQYLIINMMFRSGKSDVSSRMLPSWFLLRHPHLRVMLASYGATLSEGFARNARDKFEKWAPYYGLALSKGSRAVDNWEIAGHRGGMRSIGLQGGQVGHGYNLGIIDDFYKSRLEAESPVIRNRVREGFQADFLTRRDPCSGIIVLAHRQHPDDLCAWLINSATPGHELYDARFPKFEVLKFPAQSPGYVTPSNPGGWMFPERWSADYYESQRAGMSPYLWSALAMQDPQPRSGNVFTLANVAEWDGDGPPAGLRWAWGWDLASTEEQRLGLKSGDPDYTCGVLAAWEPGRSAADAGTIWIRRVVRGRWAAAERERVMLQEIRRGPPGAAVYVEVVAGYKDAYTRLRELLAGERTVIPITPTTDKLTRAERCEAVFAHGRVRLAPGEDWQDRFLDEVGSFPSAPHDDQVDAMVLALDDALTKRAGAEVFGLAADRGLDASTDPLAPCRMEDEPIIRLKADGEGRQWETAVRSMADWDERGWRPVGLFRGWWLARANPSAVVWGAVDEDGCRVIFRALQSRRGEPLAAFVERVQAASMEGRTQHNYRIDAAGGEDDEEGMWRVHEILGKHRARSYPEWVPAGDLRGRRGMELIDSWIAAAAAGTGEALLVWPEDLLSQMREARMKPEARGSASNDLLGVDAPEEVISGPMMKALRVAALRSF